MFSKTEIIIMDQSQILDIWGKDKRRKGFSQQGVIKSTARSRFVTNHIICCVFAGFSQRLQLHNISLQCWIEWGNTRAISINKENYEKCFEIFSIQMTKWIWKGAVYLGWIRWNSFFSCLSERIGFLNVAHCSRWKFQCTSKRDVLTLSCGNAGPAT